MIYRVNIPDEIIAHEESTSSPEIDFSLWCTNMESLDLAGIATKTGFVDPSPYQLRAVMATPESVVFEVVEPDTGNLSGWELEYTQYCVSDESPVNPLLLDSWFLQYLYPTGVVPHMFAVSAPLQVSAGRDLIETTGDWIDTGLSLSDLSDGKIALITCNSPEGTIVPEVRYILIERSECVSLAKLFTQGGVPLPIDRVASYGIQMMNILQKLHAADVIHGNIRLDSFLTNPDSSELVEIVDFRAARLFNHAATRAVQRPCLFEHGDPGIVRGVWLSPWNSRKCVPSFRDDIYRVLFALGALMYGPRLLDFAESIIATAPTRYGYKQLLFQHLWLNPRLRGQILEENGQFRYVVSDNGWVSHFHIGDFFHPDQVPGISGNIEAVRDIFTKLYGHVLTLQVADRPNYDWLLTQLSELLRISTQTAEDST